MGRKKGWGGIKMDAQRLEEILNERVSDEEAEKATIFGVPVRLLSPQGRMKAFALAVRDYRTQQEEHNRDWRFLEHIRNERRHA